MVGGPCPHSVSALAHLLLLVATCGIVFTHALTPPLTIRASSSTALPSPAIVFDNAAGVNSAFKSSSYSPFILPPTDDFLALNWLSTSPFLHYSLQQQIFVVNDVASKGGSLQPVVTAANLNVAYGLPATGLVANSPWWNATVNCDLAVQTNANFLTLITWRFSLWNEFPNGTTQQFDDVTVAWRRRCVIPGCSNCVNGVCNEKAATCVCNTTAAGTWGGSDCDAIVHLQAASICPGDKGALTVNWRLAARTFEEFLDITGLEFYSSSFLDLPTGFSGELTFELAWMPGNYTINLYKYSWDTVPSLTQSFEVQDYEDCGFAAEVPCVYDSDCTAGRNESVDDGSCDSGSCLCGSGYYWWDCSRGCSGLMATLTEKTGTISSDITPWDGRLFGYANNADCSWRLSPEEDNFDYFVVNLPNCSINSGDSITIYDLDSYIFNLTNEEDPNPPLATFGEDCVSGASTQIYAKSLYIKWQSDYYGTARGFVLTYETGKDHHIDQGAAIGGAVGGSLGLLVCAGVFGLALWAINRRQRKQREKLTIPAELWPLQEEQAVPAAEFEPGSIKSTLSELEALWGVTFNPPFLGSREQPCQVNVPTKYLMTISNDSRHSLYYSVFLPDGGSAFSCHLTPGEGKVPSSGSDMELTLVLKLHYTTTIKRFLKIELASGSRKKTVYLPLVCEAALSDRLDPDEISLDPRPVGVGSFGAVYRGAYRNRMIAVKILRRQNFLRDEEKEEFMEEVKLYGKLRCPYIVDFVGACVVPGRLCLCTEWVSMGNLESLLAKTPLPLILQLKMIRNIAEGVSFLHSNNVIYRDLKPSNTLITSLSVEADINCKIGDFGTSRNEGNVTEYKQYTKGTGTMMFLAPEALNNKPYNFKVDVYAFAVTMHCISERSDLWAGIALWSIPPKVIAGERPPLTSKTPRMLSSLIAQCWAQDPEQRPTMLQVLQRLDPMISDEMQHIQTKDGKKQLKLAMKEIASLLPDANGATGQPGTSTNTSSGGDLTSPATNNGIALLRPDENDADGFAKAQLISTGNSQVVLASIPK